MEFVSSIAGGCARQPTTLLVALQDTNDAQLPAQSSCFTRRLPKLLCAANCLGSLMLAPASRRANRKSYKSLSSQTPALQDASYHSHDELPTPQQQPEQLLGGGRQVRVALAAPGEEYATVAASTTARLHRLLDIDSDDNTVIRSRIVQLVRLRLLSVQYSGRTLVNISRRQVGERLPQLCTGLTEEANRLPFDSKGAVEAADRLAALLGSLTSQQSAMGDEDRHFCLLAPVATLRWCLLLFDFASSAQTDRRLCGPTSVREDARLEYRIRRLQVW